MPVRAEKFITNKARSVLRAGWPASRSILLMLALWLPPCLPAADLMVPAGSIWRYLDDGSNQGTAWRDLEFSDSSWPWGRAQLGYGDGDEVTVIRSGPAGNRHITSYFRHTFMLASRAGITNLAVRLLRDDGGIVYLNGVEVFRSNMPEGPINHRTLSARATVGAEEQMFFPHPVLPELLRTGANVIAVEIHQADPTSTDVSFDLELVANTPLGNFPPFVQFLSPRTGAKILPGEPVEINSESFDIDGVVTRIELLEGAKLVASGEAEKLSWSFSTNVPGFYTFTARAFDQAGAMGTSRPLTVAVVEPGSDAAVFPEFATTHGLLLQGRASLLENVLRVNPSSGGTGGGWLARKLYLSEGFEAFFRFQVTEVRGIGADGFAFVIQGASYPQLGGSGGNMGYGGMTNSLALEFDIFRNTGYNDPNDNHLSIQTRGTNANSAHVSASLALSTGIPNLKAGRIHALRIHYTPGTLRVYFDEASSPILTASVHLDQLLNLEFGRAWVGFTASTGDDRAAHDILSFWIKTKTPPVTVRLEQPLQNTILPVPGEILLAADASSSYGAISTVQFFEGDTWLGNAKAEPFTFQWPLTEPRSYVFTALAIDELGNRMLSTPVTVFLQEPNAPMLLIPRGSIWNYLDDGTDQGTAWSLLEFDDSAWMFGPAELGYGDGDEATVVRSGPDGNRFITTYFRHAFELADPRRLNHLIVGLLADDGGVVHLNGVEVFRHNMPEGDIVHSTLAVFAVTGANETVFHHAVIPLGSLREGRNLLAVEIHQAAPSSTDISFDFELAGIWIEPRINRIDLLPEGGYRLAFSTESGRGYTVQYSYDLATWFEAQTKVTGTGGTSFWSDQGPPNTVSPPETEPVRFYRVRLDP